MANCTACTVTRIEFSALKRRVLEVNFGRQAVNARPGRRVMV